MSAADASAAVAERILSDLSGKMVCTIAGESGVGKTTLAHACVRALAGRGVRALLLHQDDYFHLPPRANHRRRLADLDHIGPNEVDWPRLHTVVAAVVDGAAETLGRHLIRGDRFADRRINLSGVQVLILEGTYVTTFEPSDLRVFVEGSPRSTAAARARRGRDEVDAFSDRVLAIEHRLIGPHRELADLVFAQLSPVA